MNARIVEQAKVMISSQYVAISQFFSSLMWKQAWAKFTITTKKQAIMCQVTIALSRSTSYLLAFMTQINFLNPHIRIKQEMTKEMFVAEKTSVNALFFPLLNKTQSIAGNPTVISVTTMFTILRLLLCFSGSIPFLISSICQDITQYLNAKNQWASLKATIFRNYIAIYICWKN